MGVETRDFVNVVIRTHLHPRLREHGFVGKGRTWNRGADFKHVIDLQTPKVRVPGSGSFTMNLGVFVPEVYRIVWDKEPSEFVKETDCVVRTRLGALMDGGILDSHTPKGKIRDHWWDFDKDTDAAKLGQEVVGLLIDRGLPFMDQFESLPTIHDFLVRHERWMLQDTVSIFYLAVIKALLGDGDGASLLLGRIEERLPILRDRIDGIFLRLGFSR
jgi:hypothetical protein